MLLPKKVKYRKWQTGRRNPKREATWAETRGTLVSFGTFGLKAMTTARVKSNQLEAARKVMSHHIGKTGKIWTRVFPDKPFTGKPAEVGMGSGKGDPQGYCVEIRPGRVMFEIDGVGEEQAREALRKAATKLPMRSKIIGRF
jgi:large subunit ribosomal protein L16